jgi:GNAT superfamily N-acetyltransferase
VHPDYRVSIVTPSPYAAVERLREGGLVHIRSIRPSDRNELIAAFERTSDQTRYLRFFAPKKGITEADLDFSLNVDSVNHVALAAILEENDARQVLVGAGRYVVSVGLEAELALMVDDAHQGLGIGTQLLRHLILIARQAGLQALEAEVLSANTPMLAVFKHCGLRITTRHETGVVRVRLDLTPEPAMKQG